MSHIVLDYIFFLPHTGIFITGFMNENNRLFQNGTAFTAGLTGSDLHPTQQI